MLNKGISYGIVQPWQCLAAHCFGKSLCSEIQVAGYPNVEQFTACAGRACGQQRSSVALFCSLGSPAQQCFTHDVPAVKVHASVQGAVATPAAAGAAPDPNPPAKTPWRTPPPVFDDAETPAAASGWQELCGADEDAEGARGGPRY